MQYNYAYEEASLFFLTIILIKFFAQRRFPLITTRYLGVIIVTAEVSLISDITSAYLLEHMSLVPIWVIYVLNFIYYATEIMLPSALSLYLLALLNNHKAVSQKTYRLFWLPMFFNLGVLVVGLLTGKVFTISITEGYSTGPWAFITYLSFVIYFLMSLWLMIKIYKYIGPVIVTSFTVIIAVLLSCVAAQYFNPKFLLSGMGAAIGIAIIYFTVEDPQSMVDKTSGLYNYNAFQLFLQSRLSSSKSPKIVAFEVHGLKNINLRYGMKGGDWALHYVGDYLNNQKHNWVFRIAPCRFVMATYNENTYYSFLGRLAELKNSRIPYENDFLDLTYSVCTYLHMERYDTISSITSVINKTLNNLLESEDRARIINIDDEALDKIDDIQYLEESVKKYIKEGKNFVMHYQPIFNTQSKVFDSAEALVRISGCISGKLNPAYFIPVAEKSGLSVDLDEIIIKLVLDDIKSGCLDGLNHIHINMSAASFVDEYMTDKLIELVRSRSVDPSMIVVEITETAAVSEQKTLEKCLYKLTAAGIKVSMDDFGTGYSNIRRVLELPFDMVKLDRSLLLSKKEIFRDMATVLRHIAPNLVAEGVETEEQARFVTECGIDHIQGYYYSKPVPKEEIADLIRNKRG